MPPKKYYIYYCKGCGDFRGEYSPKGKFCPAPDCGDERLIKKQMKDK